MVQITHTIDIDGSRHQVYVALRSVNGYPTWLRHSAVYRGTTLRSASDDPRTAYEDSTTVGRMRGELLEDDPDRALRFHQAKPSGSLDAVIRYQLDDGDARTHVTRTGDLTTRGMLRLMQAVLVRVAAAESKRTMKALKAHVEHPA
jgi:hypothetical protein